MTMRKILAAAAFVGLSLSSGGCAYVTSAQPGMSVATGEAWYTKDKFILFIPLGTDFYYCPGGNKTCYKADVK